MAINWDTLNPLAKKVIEGIVEQYNEEQAKLKPVNDDLNDARYVTVEEIINTFDTYQIAKLRRNDTGEMVYAPYVNFKPANEWAGSLDKALLHSAASWDASGCAEDGTLRRA